MDKVNKLIYNSFIYRFIEWICLITQDSYVFKVKLMTTYKEKQLAFKRFFFYGCISRFGEWLDLKVKSSLTYTGIEHFRDFLLDNSYIAGKIGGIKWIYFLPFFVWIDRLIRALNLPLASYWDELYILFLFGVIAYRRFYKDIKYYFTTIDFVVILFAMIYLFVTISNSPRMGIGIEGFRVVTQYILIFTIMVQLVDSDKAIRVILWSMLISVGLLGLHGSYQFITGAEIPAGWVDSGEDVRSRAFSILGSPNALASILVMFLPVSFSMFVAVKEPLKKIAALILTAFIGFGLLFTLSRGAWAAAGVGFLIFFFFTAKRLIFPLAGIAGFAMVSIEQIWSRIYYLFTPEYQAKSATGGRIYRYSEALAKWARNNKLFGIGVGRYGGAVATNHGLSPFYMDSFYIKTLTEAGLLGLVSYLILIVSTVLTGFQYILATKDRQYRIIGFGILSGLVGVLVHNAVENIFEIPYMVTYFWALAALLVAMYREDAKKRVVKEA